MIKLFKNLTYIHHRMLVTGPHVLVVKCSVFTLNVLGSTRSSVWIKAELR